MFQAKYKKHGIFTTGAEQKVKAQLADVRLYCAEGVAEAEACNDAEGIAEFLLLGVVLDMQDGSSVDLTKELLTVSSQQIAVDNQLTFPVRRARMPTEHVICQSHYACNNL